MRSILLHPHPDMGGTMHHPVIAALYAQLPDATRFAFTSADLTVATAQVHEHLGAGPAWLVGYSFGGGVAALVDDPRVVGWCLVAPALAMVEPVIGADPRPKHVRAAEHDGFFSPASLDALTADWPSTTHTTLPGADHFLGGREQDVVDWCTRMMSLDGPMP